MFSLVVAVWSGAGSNRRPSAFQVNHAKRYADLQKRTSLTSGTALGGRCKIHASTVRYVLSSGVAAILLKPRAEDCPEAGHYHRSPRTFTKELAPDADACAKILLPPPLFFGLLSRQRSRAERRATACSGGISSRYQWDSN